jgi:archaellum component FlaC
MESDFRKTLEGKLKQLRAELEERTASIPIHSMRPHQLIRIEELEEEINEIEEKLDQAKSPPS